MKLSIKTVLIHLIATGCFVIAMFLVFNAILIQGFKELEHFAIDQDVSRAEHAFSYESEILLPKVRDWAVWDDSYHFMEDKNQDYLDANFTADSLAELGSDYAIYFDTNGKLFWGTKSNTFPPTPDSIDKAVLDKLNSIPELRIPNPDNKPFIGFLSIDQAQLLFAAHPILPTSGEESSRGMLVFAEWLNSDLEEKIAQRMRLKLSFIPLKDKGMRPRVKEFLEKARSNKDIVVDIEDANTISGYRLLNDFQGKPAIAIQVKNDRNIFRQGIHTRNIIVVILIVGGLVFGAISLFLLNRSVVRRLSKLSEEVKKVSESADTSLRVEDQGDDEISSLAESVNYMLTRIDAAYEAISLAKTQAEAANVAKSQFIANVSHEIRTPMNAVLGFTDLLSRTQLNDKQKSHLEVARQAARHLMKILDSVLDFSKIEAGRLSLESYNFDLPSVVTEAAQLFQVAAADKGLDLKVLLSMPRPLAVMGDGDKLRRVIQNLISNSIKFTEIGGVAIYGSAETTTSTNANITIRIEDTGIGIPEEKQTHVFEAFEQADSSTTRKYGGTGLGLTICKRIIDLMGGKLQYKPRDGGGSVFIIELSLPMPKPEEMAL